MKKIIFILILGLSLAAALPWINGLAMEQLATRALDNTNQMYADMGSDARFELVSYDRGYGRTQAEWKIDLGALSNVYGVKEIIFTETAEHSLLGVTSRTGLEKNRWYAEWLASVEAADGSQGQSPLTIETRYSVLSPITSTVAMDAFILDTGKTRLKIGALDAVVTVDKSFEKVAVKGRWEGLSEGENDSLGPVSFESEQERISGILWKGWAKAVLASFKTGTGKESVDLSALSVDVKMDTNADQTRMTVGMGVSTDRMILGSQEFGGWTFKGEIRQMDIEAYEAVYASYTRLVNQALSQMSAPGLSPEESGWIMARAMAEGRASLVAHLEKMLKKDLEINISELDLTLPQGRLEGRLSLGLKQDMTIAQFFPVLAQPALVLDIFFLDSAVSMDQGLAAEAPNLTDPVFPGMKTGLFTIQDNRLVHEAQTREDGLYLNGHKVDLDYYTRAQ